MIRFTLRLPDDVHGALEYEARLAHRSLHGEILLRLKESLEGTPERVLTGRGGSGESQPALTATAPATRPEDLEVVGTMQGKEVTLGNAIPDWEGKCLFDTPKGTKCKACGKTH